MVSHRCAEKSPFQYRAFFCGSENPSEILIPASLRNVLDVSIVAERRNASDIDRTTDTRNKVQGVFVLTVI